MLVIYLSLTCYIVFESCFSILLSWCLVIFFFFSCSFLLRALFFYGFQDHILSSLNYDLFPVLILNWLLTAGTESTSGKFPVDSGRHYSSYAGHIGQLVNWSTYFTFWCFPHIFVFFILLGLLLLVLVYNSWLLSFFWNANVCWSGNRYTSNLILCKKHFISWSPC